MRQDAEVQRAPQIRGAGAYTADLETDALRLRFVTSPHAHARIVGIDVTGALTHPGVVAVFTAATLPTVPIHEIPMIPTGFAQPALATDVVRFVGEYVAAVVAETDAAAVDAAELVVVDYAPLPVAADPRAALAPGAPTLFPDHGTNVALAWDHDTPLDAAERLVTALVRVDATVSLPRVAVAPMEGRAALAVPGPDDTLTLWLSTQSPHWSRTQIARSLALAPARIRVITPLVGGGFGGKANGGVAAYVATAAAARALCHPVRFVEERADNLITMHGRGLHLSGTLRATVDGAIVDLTVDETCDAGGYPGTGAVEPGKTALMACGPYRVPAVRFHGRSVATNGSPTGAYRGPGRSEAALLLEVLLDGLAHTLGLDPVEVRRRNLLRPEEVPATTVTGATYDAIDAPAVLDALLDAVDYPAARAEQARRNATAPRIARGIGISTVIDSTAWFARQEPARVFVDATGAVHVVCGTASAGQLHGRAYATLVAEVLPVDPDDVVVLEGDTDAIHESGGTSGSRSLQLAGAAVHAAAEAVWSAVRDLAADLLEAAADDVVVAGRTIAVRGVPARAVTLREVAAHAAAHDRALDAHCTVDQPEATFTVAAHCAVVDVDLATGAVTPVRHVAVTDCGTVIDLPSAAGQVVGATVQGIAQALYEECVADEQGNPRTASLAEYAMPSAAEVPPIEATFVTTPSPANALGARGVGEVGMVAAPPAVYGAVLDALRPYGVERIDLPCTPERVWRALRDAGV